MWRKSSNSNSVIPPEIDEVSSADVVYVRKNFVLKAETEDVPLHYEYDEITIPKSDWELYKNILTHDKKLIDTEIALVEIYEMLQGV